MGVSGIMYGDTLLNTSTILQREGIRKITASQSSPENTKTFSPITTYLTATGTIDTKISCIRRSKSVDSGFCVTDTVLYDSKGRPLEFISKSATGNTYLQCKLDYVGEQKVKYTWITTVPQKSKSDTIVTYHYYNENGQLVRFEKDAKQFDPVNASLYYGHDGLPDSIRHDNPAWGTYVFNRRERRKTKEIEMETASAKFKWVYNSSGQCITSEWVRKTQLNTLHHFKKKLRTDAEANYYYNSDGTLSKVVEKINGGKILFLHKIKSYSCYRAGRSVR